MGDVLSQAEIEYLKSMVPILAETVIIIDGKPLELERNWQVDLVGSTNENEIWAKARQIGYSYGTAIRTLCRAQLFGPASYNAVFVSINREEAREKIRYLEFLYDAMQKRKKVIIANKLEVEFENGNRITSNPSRAVRGISNVDLYLDEFAHIKEAREIYSGSTASTVRQSYGVTIGSTPFGRGAFYDIFHGAGNEGEYRRFVARNVPWWLSHILCTNVLEASIFAPGMSTEERVALFGAPNLIREFENQPLEVFQQEFEVFFQDYGNSALSFDLMMSCADGDMVCQPVDIDCSNRVLQPMELIEMAVTSVKAETRGFKEVFIGMDVGRAIHASEIMIGDWVGGKLLTRLYITLRKCPLPDQRGILTKLFGLLPIVKCRIDSQGIGKNLVEDLQKSFGLKVEDQPFSENSKSEMVGMLIKAFEDKILKFYPTRRICAQLLDVKKLCSTTGRILYRSAQNKDQTDGSDEYKAHADLFWAMAMMTMAAQDLIMGNQIIVTSRSPIIWMPGMRSGWSGQPLRFNFKGRQ